MAVLLPAAQRDGASPAKQKAASAEIIEGVRFLKGSGTAVIHQPVKYRSMLENTVLLGYAK